MCENSSHQLKRGQSMPPMQLQMSNLAPHVLKSVVGRALTSQPGKLNAAISWHSTCSSAQHWFQIGSFPLTQARSLVLLVARFQYVLESVLSQWVHSRALWRRTEQTRVFHTGYSHPERHWNCVGLGSYVFVLVLPQIHTSSSNTIQSVKVDL